MGNSMQNTINITVNEGNLSTSILLVNLDESAYTEISLQITSICEDYEVIRGGFVVPWIYFKGLLTPLSKLARNYGIKINFSEFSIRIVKNYLTSLKARKELTNLLSFDNSTISEILERENFNRILKDEQFRDLNKLLSIYHGANFSVPGAGKTTTLLALFTILRNYHIVNKLFVVAPKNAFISWEDEIEEIFEKKNTIRVNKNEFSNLITNDKTEIFLINYEKLRDDECNKLIPFFLKHKVHFVLDESHRIKSGTSNLSFQQINKLADLATRRDIMSGTPMPQYYSDLFSQFEFLWREDIFSNELEYIDEEHKSELVHETISPLFVRTIKDELDLSPPSIEYKFVEMGPVQEEIYTLVKSEFARQISGMPKEDVRYYRNLGKSVVRLLQIATNPMLLGSEDQYFDDEFEINNNSPIWSAIWEYSKFEKPVKIEYLDSYVNNLLNARKDTKLVIWSYFIKNIKLLEKYFNKFSPVSIYGAIPTGDDDENSRENRIRRFHNDPDCRILIGNPQACGEGISLHKASHHAIYLDRNFNAAYYLQSIDRIHRLGLPKDIETKISILVTKNTIDEVLIDRLNQKTKRMGDVLNDPYLHQIAYDPDDIPIEESLGLDKEDYSIIAEHISLH